jgi:protein-tyrosine phosphatase
MAAVDWWQNRSHHEVHSRRSERPSVSEIIPELLIGEYPRVEDIAWLKQTFVVTAVHNLQDDEDLRLNGLDIKQLEREYRTHGIKFLRTAIQDGSADAMGERLKQALHDLNSLMSAGHRVYLHCNAGLNRAPTLAIGYLRGYRKMSLDEAVAHLKKRRACGPFMTILEDYFGPRHIRPE